MFRKNLAYDRDKASTDINIVGSKGLGHQLLEKTFHGHSQIILRHKIIQQNRKIGIFSHLSHTVADPLQKAM